ncbi:MAG: hypothetical protein KDH15_06895 [Rhodocyclaceae bacterium]|nr:hypothetical protein [Rhodocyclaceae bacterium]
MRSMLHLGLAAMLCLRATLATAEIASETAILLIDLSGMAHVLEYLPGQVQAGFRKGFAAGGGELPAAHRAQIEAAVDSAYSAPRMRASVLERLTRELQPDQARDLLRWYRSDLGAEISRLETAGLDDERTNERIIADNAARVAALPPARRTLLERAINASRAVQMAEDVVINTTIGLEYGARLARGQAADAAVLDELRGRIEVSRPALSDAFGELSLAMSADTYRSLSDEQLASYVEFLESPAGRRFHEIGVAAFDGTLFDAARLLGRLLPLGDGRPI